MKSNSIFSQSESSHLAEKEKTALNYIEHVVDSSNASEQDTVINKLLKFSGDLLLKFYNCSEKLKNFCSTNKKFHAAIASVMREHSGVGLEIHSIDNKEKLTFFDILVATKYYDEYCSLSSDSDESRAQRMQALNKSCEIGFFASLSVRCEINASHLLNANLSCEEKTKLEESTLHDLNRLCNLYWPMGYIQAGCLLKKYSNDLSNKDRNKDKLDRAAAIYEEGIRRTLCASFLETNSYSVEIEKSLTGGKGYLAEQNNPQYRNWDDYKTWLCQWSGSNENYERLYNFAKQEIEELLPNGQKEEKMTP